MREIKFRAFIKSKGKYEYVTLQDIFAIGSTYWENDWWDEIKEFEEYTGHKDKNGKEIYENDIVLINHPHDMTGDFTNSKQRVLYLQGSFVHSNGNRPPKTMFEYSEVIGNINANPDLYKAYPLK
jgi:uncharacterized phage protein (TIGR01671 family)